MTIRLSFLSFVLAVIACAVLAPTPTASEASHGNYCGGEGLWNPGQPVNFTEWCKQKHGSTATAVIVRQDAYGWVCRVPGKPDAEIDVQNACHKKFGDESLATLVGVGPNDWRCLWPKQIPRHVVPVLLLPASRVRAAESAYVFSALRRIEYLMNGVRHFYKTHSYVYVGASNAFVLPTATSPSQWRTLAPTAEGAGWSQGAYHARVLQELEKGGWNKFKPSSLVRVGAFVALGTPGQPDTLPPTQQPARPLSFLSPSSAWALPAAKINVSLAALPFAFSLPISASDATCAAGGPNISNTPAYETAFFQVGNRLGSSLGLPPTDHYAFGGLLLRPDNIQQSIMLAGYGTKSLLFPFEAAALYAIWGSMQ